jgi:hypothetical protein
LNLAEILVRQKIRRRKIAFRSLGHIRQQAKTFL